MENKTTIKLDMSKNSLYQLEKFYYNFMHANNQQLTDDYLDCYNSQYFKEEDKDKVTYPIYCFGRFIAFIEEHSNEY